MNVYCKLTGSLLPGLLFSSMHIAVDQKYFDQVTSILSLVLWTHAYVDILCYYHLRNW